MTEPTAATVTDEDEFNSAFDEGSPPASAGAPASQPPLGAPAAAPAPTEPASSTEPITPAQTPKTEGAQDSGSATETEWQRRYKELEHSTKSWDGRLKASARREQELLAQVETLKAERVTPSVTAPADDWQNDPELKKAAEEYPDVVAPLLKAFKASRVTAPAPADVKPLSDRVEQLAREQHFARIAEKHSDFRELAQSDALPEWVQSKPAYLRPGLQNILQHGTSEEVVELLTDFKAERDAKAQSQTADAARAAEAEKRQKQMQAAGAVKGRSGGVPQAEPAPDDFDTAWRMAPD